jgi:LPS-assembly protein
VSPYLPRPAVGKLILAVVPFLLHSGFLPVAHAEQVATEEWDISADRLLRFDSPSSIVAEGNVVLIKKERLPANPPAPKTAYTSWAELLGEETEPDEVLADEVVDEEEQEPQYKTTVTIRADWMAYDVEMQTIKAKGAVEIISEDDQLYAKEGTVNLNSETGTFSEATIIRKEDSLHLEGETIEKTGFDTYRIIDGWAITCKIDKDEEPPWSFASARTDITEGGYALLKHARFNIKGVPILYSPYLIVPVKNTRQSGLLFPEFSVSDNSGFGFNLPFFWNISDSADVTFFPEYYANRGFMPGAEFRYVTSATDKGTFTASFLDDQLSDPSEVEYYRNTGYTHDNSDRWWIRGKADNNFGGWESRLDLDVVSDQDYLDEFNSGTTGFKKSHTRYLKDYGRGFQNQTSALRQNSFKVLNSWRGMFLEADLLAINDARTVTPDTNTPLWKLPSVAFTGAVPIGETDFTFDWNADYVNYWREDGIGGHRLDLKPSVSAPLRVSPYLESRASVALRDTFYAVEEYGDASWDNGTTQNRLVPEGLIETATTLQRNFFADSEDSSKGFIHLLRPFINYTYIPDVDQDELPRFDDVDFVGEQNTISYGIDNFINFLRNQVDGSYSGNDYLWWKLEQSYDLRDVGSDEPFSNIESRLEWRPYHNTYLLYKAAYDVYESEFPEHTLESGLRNSRGDQFTVDYSFKDRENIEQINASILAHISASWIAGALIEHSLSQEETIRTTASLTYQALCWSVRFETEYTPTDTTFLVLFNLANIGMPFGIDL